MTIAKLRDLIKDLPGDLEVIIKYPDMADPHGPDLTSRINSLAVRTLKNDENKVLEEVVLSLEDL